MRRRDWLASAAVAVGVSGDQFALRFKFDITPKATGERATMDEVGLYTVKDGKITEERFYY